MTCFSSLPGPELLKAEIVVQLDQHSPQPAPHTLTHIKRGQGTALAHTAGSRRNNKAGRERKRGRIKEKEKKIITFQKKDVSQ